MKANKNLKATILASIMLATTMPAKADEARAQTKAATQLQNFLSEDLKTESKPDDFTTIKTGNLIVGEKGSEMHFLSENGRYVFTGRMVDVWEAKEIRSIADIKATEGKINLKKMGFTPERLNAFIVGLGNKQVVNIFIDPLCEFCNPLIKKARSIAASSKEYQFNFIVVPALGNESHRLAKTFFCSSESTEKKVDALLSGKIENLQLKENCDMRNYDMTLYAATSSEVTGVPFLIHPDGLTTAGVPTNLIYWLEGKGKQ